MKNRKWSVAYSFQKALSDSEPNGSEIEAEAGNIFSGRFYGLATWALALLVFDVPGSNLGRGFAKEPFFAVTAFHPPALD